MKRKAYTTLSVASNVPVLPWKVTHPNDNPKHSIGDFGCFGNTTHSITKKATSVVDAGGLIPFAPLKITRRKHDSRASVLSRAVEPLRARRLPPHFLHLDWCRCAKDARRRDALLLRVAHSVGVRVRSSAANICSEHVARS